MALVARPGDVGQSPLAGWAIAAALGACCLYGVVGVLVKRAAQGVPPRAMAAARALTVTYLIPVFGVPWGVLFLGESVSAPMLGGGALAVLGTVLVLRK